jgi:putative DNA primase/helicase
MRFSDRVYTEADFPIDPPEEAPVADRKWVADGSLMPCAVDAISRGVQKGMRDMAAYRLAHQCCRVGMAQAGAESTVTVFLQRCGGPDLPDARQKVRSAYRGHAHPAGCEFWRGMGMACDPQCALNQWDTGRRRQTVTLKLCPASSGSNGNGHGPNVQADDGAGDEEHEEITVDRSAVNMNLARAWSDRMAGRMLYVEGDQWWRYDRGAWRYSSAEAATASVQRFVERSGMPVTGTRVREVVYLAKSMLGPIEVSRFDSHPTWISLANGVYDIDAAELMDHDPDHLLTYQADYSYDPDAECPLWRSLLHQWLIETSGCYCDDWADLLQEWFGYCLIPDNSAQCSMFWLGEGGNGKGVATRVLEGLVGRRQCTAIPIEQLHEPYHRADLQGKLVGFVNEPDPKSMAKNGNWFKAITGGDSISARRPTEKVFSFTPHCRIILSANDLPGTQDVSRGFFRRIVMIEWRYNVPEEQRDELLDDKLRAELPGILNWALEGLARLRGRDMRFQVPGESRALLDDYRQGEDSIGRFVREECDQSADYSTVARTLFKAYATWSRDAGIRTESETRVFRRFAKMGFASDRAYVDGRRSRVWVGLRLQSKAGEVEPTLDDGTDNE